MRPRHLAFLACTITVAAIAACGDDDDSSGGGGGSVDTGLPASDKLSSLDDSDAQQACTSTAHAFNTILPESKLEQIGCALAAISVIVTDKQGDVSASDIADCKKIVQDCLAGKLIGEDGEPVEIDTELANDASCKTVTAEESFGDCGATVADYESCAGKVVSDAKVRFSAVSCDVLKDYDGFQESSNAEIDVSDAQQCKALRDKCPDLDLSSSGEASDDEG